MCDHHQLQGILVQNIKLVQTEAADEQSVVAVVVRTAKKEARAVKGIATDYELDQFTYAHTLAHTRCTLLALVSELVVVCMGRRTTSISVRLKDRDYDVTAHIFLILSLTLTPNQ